MKTLTICFIALVTALGMVLVGCDNTLDKQGQATENSISELSRVVLDPALQSQNFRGRNRQDENGQDNLYRRAERSRHDRQFSEDGRPVRNLHGRRSADGEKVVNGDREKHNRPRGANMTRPRHWQNGRPENNWHNRRAEKLSMAN